MEERPVPTLNQLATLEGAVSATRAAGDLLTDQIHAESDSELAARLRREHDRLDGLLSQLLHAQGSADDAAFADATAALRSQAETLKADRAAIEAIVKDAAAAASIARQVARALRFIAKL
jgi:hypothetical protein